MVIFQIPMTISGMNLSPQILTSDICLLAVYKPDTFLPPACPEKDGWRNRPQGTKSQGQKVKVAVFLLQHLIH